MDIAREVALEAVRERVYWGQDEDGNEIVKWASGSSDSILNSV